jgi:hypothetical protein
MSTHSVNVEESWFAIEALSRSMRDAASSEEWLQVVELAASRHRNLLHHFQRFPVGPENAGFYQDHLTRMLDGERELQALALDARRRVMREGAVANHNRRAVGAYLAS